MGRSWELGKGRVVGPRVKTRSVNNLFECRVREPALWGIQWCTTGVRRKGRLQGKLKLLTAEGAAQSILGESAAGSAVLGTTALKPPRSDELPSCRGGGV